MLFSGRVGGWFVLGFGGGVEGFFLEVSFYEDGVVWLGAS